jgi:hypothetical protein
MRFSLMLFALAAVSLVNSRALANCEDVWGTYSKERPDTCTPLTNETLVSLEGATREQVISVMKATGRPLAKGEDVLHFVGASDHDSGDVNFAFDGGDVVVRIFGFLDAGEQFVWNPSFTGLAKAFIGIGEMGL